MNTSNIYGSVEIMRDFMDEILKTDFTNAVEHSIKMSNYKGFQNIEILIFNEDNTDNFTIYINANSDIKTIIYFIANKSYDECKAEIYQPPY